MRKNLEELGPVIVGVLLGLLMLWLWTDVFGANTKPLEHQEESRGDR